MAYLIDSADSGGRIRRDIAICLQLWGPLLTGLCSRHVWRSNVSYDPGYDTTYTWHGPFPFPAAALGILFILIPLTIVASWLYFALMESSARQGTLGKIALGLFVTDLKAAE